jgi:hypothetical protein
VAIRRRSFSRDLPSADLIDHELQEIDFGVGDADDQASTLIRMETRQRNCAFAIDESGDVSRGALRE